MVYTASISQYADPIIDKIDPLHRISYRLYREHCKMFGNAFAKDLSQLGRNLKDTIIIDNSPISYVFQPLNAIPIDTWIDDANDKQLLNLIPILEGLSVVNDVRAVLKYIVQANAVDFKSVLGILKTQLKSR